jgi:hypothetical protein
MRNRTWWSVIEALETYDETPYGSGACDDEFVGILTLATEQGSTIDILMELLEDLTSYEQKYDVDPFELHHQLDQDEDALDIDFLLWSRTYYRFIALSSLTRVW